MTVPDHPLRHSAARPTPRLYLVKACALLCTAFPLLALAAPARAGHWVLSTTGSGQAMVGSGGMLQTFTPPSPSTNSVTINSIGAGWGIGPCFGGTPDTITAKANLQVTVTGTWTSDANSDNTAPPGVWLSESSTARATCTNTGVDQPGSADDGWGDPVGQSGSQMGISAPPSSPKYVKQSGGSFTVPLTLSASASGKQGMYQGGGGASATVGPITIAVHAQPYNWHDAGWTTGDPHGPDTTAGGYVANGSISFRYKWSSTSGNLGDLAGIKLYEKVDYTGNQGTFHYNADGTVYYYPPHPPIGSVTASDGTAVPFHISNPETASVDPTQGLAGDQHSAWPTQTPLSAFTCDAPQTYQFDDPTTREVGVVLFGPNTIEDAVKLNPNQFLVSKSGAQGLTPL